MMTDKWTDRQTEFPLVDSTPVRDRVKTVIYIFADVLLCLLSSRPKRGLKACPDGLCLRPIGFIETQQY